MAAYRVWKSEDEEARIEEMKDCCRYAAEQTTSYEACFECPICKVEWESS